MDPWHGRGGHQCPSGDPTSLQASQSHLSVLLNSPDHPPDGQIPHKTLWGEMSQGENQARLGTLTVHGEVDGLLAGEGVIGDGDLHLVGTLISQLQRADEQRAILQHADAVTVVRPQVADDLGADGLDDGDRLVPLQLPLHHRLVGAGAGVAHRQQRRLACRAAHQRRRAGDVHPRQQTWGRGGDSRRRVPALRKRGKPPPGAATSVPENPSPAAPPLFAQRFAKMHASPQKSALGGG